MLRLRSCKASNPTKKTSFPIRCRGRSTRSGRWITKRSNGSSPRGEESVMPAHLHNGDVFPDLVVDLVAGRTIALPRDLAGSYAVVLLYRGAWCPYCCAQLAAFSRAGDRLAAAGI